MASVQVSRSFPGSVAAVRGAMEDLGPFMRAAGFDAVTVEGTRLEITNRVGLLTIDLSLRVLETDADLAYEQVEGIFDAMETRYAVTEESRAVAVTATTEFELDVSMVGSILDSTIISRQRRTELNGQLDYLERVAAG